MLDIHQQKLRHKVKRHTRLHSFEMVYGNTCAPCMEMNRAVLETKA